MPSDEPRRAPVATTNAAPLHREVTLGDGQTVTLAEASGVAFAEATSPRARRPRADAVPVGRWIIALVGGAIGGFVWSRSARRPDRPA